MILEFIVSLSYNSPHQASCRGSLSVPALPYCSHLAMIEMHFQHTTANGTDGFAAAARRRTAKP